MADSKKSALLNAAKKLKGAKSGGSVTEQNNDNVKKSKPVNAAGNSIFDKIKNAVSKVDHNKG